MVDRATRYSRLLLAVIMTSNALLYMTAEVESYASAKKSFLFHQMTPFQEGITPVERNKSYSDFLLSNESKVYLTEFLDEGSLLILFFTTNPINASLDVSLEGPAERMRLSLAYHPRPYIYYVERRGQVRIVAANLEKSAVYYSFLVDISEPLRDMNSKILPEGGQIAFHTDLRKDDRVSLHSDSYNNKQFRMRVFALCYEVTGVRSSYMLCFREESLKGTLDFTADLGGRYYILIGSIESEGTVSLKSVITSPPWGQDWPWSVFNILFIALLSSFFIIMIRRTRNLDTALLYALIGYYCCFITIGFSASLIGSFNYGALISIPLFYLSTISYGLSLGMLICAARLDRKKTIVFCSNCGKRVNLRENNYCCGKKVKNISFAWFLVPVSLSLLFFVISKNILERSFPQFIEISLWVEACGSIIGGIIAWWINKDIDRRSWKFLATGVLFSSLSPYLTVLLLDLMVQPHIELEWPGKMTRIRIAPPTLPSGTMLAFATLAAGLSFAIALEIRKLHTRSVDRSEFQ